MEAALDVLRNMQMEVNNAGDVISESAGWPLR